MGTNSENGKSKKNKRRLRKEVRYVLYALIILISVLVIIGLITTNNRFVYEEQLDTIVITIDDTNISLKELTYYFMKVEEKGDEAAKTYDPNNPKAYWNVYVHNTDDSSGYVTDMAKKAAIDACIRDNIYAKEALKAGFEFTSEEESDLRYDAQSRFELMKNKQRKVSQLSADDFFLIMTKEQLSYKYMIQLAENDGNSILDAIMLKYDVGGSYYETLKSTYSITINNKILDNIVVGYVTIN